MSKQPDYIADYIANRPLGSGTPSIDVSAVNDAVLLIELPTGRLYADRDALLLDQLGGYYSRHVSGMTREQLHSKADIAAELAHRDMLIDASVARLTAVMSERAAEASEYSHHVAQLAAARASAQIAAVISCIDLLRNIETTYRDNPGMGFAATTENHTAQTFKSDAIAALTLHADKIRRGEA